MSTTLREWLKEWTEVDDAIFCFAVVLGLMPYDKDLFSGAAKHVVATSDPLGIFLYKTLQKYVALGILEFRNEDEMEFRWNPNYKGSWE